MYLKRCVNSVCMRCSVSNRKAIIKPVSIVKCFLLITITVSLTCAVFHKCNTIRYGYCKLCLKKYERAICTFKNGCQVVLEIVAVHLSFMLKHSHNIKYSSWNNQTLSETCAIRFSRYKWVICQGSYLIYIHINKYSTSQKRNILLVKICRFYYNLVFYYDNLWRVTTPF